jgi:hypothetical protein
MAGPGADLRENATPLVLGDESITPTDGLTDSPGDNSYGHYYANGSAWWSFTPTASGFIVISTGGSTAGDCTLRVYLAGADLTDSHALLHFDDDSAGSGQARIKMQVVAGRTYQFVVGFYNPPPAGAYVKLTLSDYRLFDQPQATPLGVPGMVEEAPSHLRLSPDGTQVAALLGTPIRLGGSNKYYDWSGGVVIYDLALPELVEVRRFQLSPFRSGLNVNASHDIFRLMWSLDGSTILVSDGTNMGVCNVATGAVTHHTWPSGHYSYGVRPVGDGFVWIRATSSSPYAWSRGDIAPSGSLTWSSLPLNGYFNMSSFPSITADDWVHVSSDQVNWYRFDGSVAKTISFRPQIDPSNALSYWVYNNNFHRRGNVVYFMATNDYGGGQIYLCWVDIVTGAAGKFDLSAELPKTGYYSYFSTIDSIDDDRMGVVHVRDSSHRGVVAAIDVSGATPVVSDRSYLGDGVQTGRPRYTTLGDFTARDDLTPDWVYVSRIGESDDATADRERWYITNVTNLDPPPLAALRETRRRFV